MTSDMTSNLPFNLFDGAVYLLLALAIISGLRTGFMRSLATIIAYVIAAPLAVVLTPYVVPFATAQFKLTPEQTPLVIFALLAIIGFVLGILMRGAVGEMTGHRVGAADRAAGAFLGAARIVLIAVIVVMVFDRIIPAGQTPAFLADSKLRPVLSQAGEQGLRKLPPDVSEFIDKLKRERGL